MNLFSSRGCALAVLLSVLPCVLSAQEAPPHRIYATAMDPREHPDYARRAVQPPSWETFGGRTHFATLRGFGMAEGKAVGNAEEMERHVNTFKLGDVLWPSYDLIFASNLGEVLDEIKRRDLYLFDIWGYVPGSGPGGYWQQFHPPAGVFDLLESKLGERWLGMDVGEQDGRYVGGYAPQMYPVSTDRFAQYLNFQRHFERMTTDLGSKNSTLVSLNFGHYFLKEGVYTTIGAETAQGLPNGQVYYAFIRGAGKQYGVPWFGNASVWNRWGWKTYDGEGPDHGPTQGTSLSLLKRLLYSHILYNCLFVGFESSWFQGAGLSPVGRIQQAAVEWVEKNGQPGTMLTPIALMTDFYAGWTFPRHLYTDKVYRVWGNLPYEPGDFLTDGVLDMLYPGYQDSSFYHDERGFLTPTPYGDSADCLLSDAPLWLLKRYPVLVIAGPLEGGLELREKLEAYAAGGGTLIITGGNLAGWAEGLGGVKVSGPVQRVAGGATIAGDFAVTEESAFDLLPLSLPAEARVTARHGDVPMIVDVPHGAGRVIVLASLYGLPAESAEAGLGAAQIDAPLPKPYPLLDHVRTELDRLFAAQRLFEAGDGLNLVVCRKAAGEYTLCITNNGLAPLPYKVVSHCGPIESISELPTDEAEKPAAGYLPTGLDGTDVGTSSAEVLAGGDVKLFSVRVREEGMQEIAHEAPKPRPQGRLLPLRNIASVKEALLARPTFFEHFDGVLVDWRYLRDRADDSLAAEAGWLKRQGLRVVVDLTSGINLYPDLRLIDNDPPEYAASMALIDDILRKMPLLGAADLLVALHRTPENNFTGAQTQEGFQKTLGEICAKAQAAGISVHLRSTLNVAGLRQIAELADRVNAPNLRIAPSTALLLQGGSSPEETAALLKDRAGLWLASSAARDHAGVVWSAQAPLAGGTEVEALRAMLGAAPEAPIALDGVYADQDAEYRDISLLETATHVR